MKSEQTCQCGKPVRDTLTLCDPCTDDLGKALGDIPWLVEQLEITATKAKGVDYRGVGGGKGGKKPAETPLPVHWGASEATTHLRALLVSWSLFCHQEDVATTDMRPGLPDDNLIAMSRWLLWRVDGLARHELGPDALDELTSAVAHCERVIDRHADRQYLGQCDGCNLGDLWAKPGGEWATCDHCEIATVADEVREHLVNTMRDSLRPAAEIARLSTYLGLRSTRERTLSRITTWAKRGRIISTTKIDGHAAYRFGDVYDLLAAEAKAD
jgi:hypothetical protein